MYCHNNPVIYIDPSGHIRNCVKEIYEKLRKENPTMSASETHKLALELTGNKPVNHLIYEAAAKFEMSYGGGETMSFEDGYAYIHNHIQEEWLRFIYQCGVRHVLFEDALALVA